MRLILQSETYQRTSTPEPGAETDTRYLSEPDLAKDLLTRIEKDISSGRSTPGPESKNDAPIVLWKESGTGGQKKRKKTKNPGK